MVVVVCLVFVVSVGKDRVVWRIEVVFLLFRSVRFDGKYFRRGLRNEFFFVFLKVV